MVQAAAFATFVMRASEYVVIAGVELAAMVAVRAVGAFPVFVTLNALATGVFGVGENAPSAADDESLRCDPEIIPQRAGRGTRGARLRERW